MRKKIKTKHFYVVDNLPEFGRVNSFLCYVNGKRGYAQFLNCSIETKSHFRIPDYEKYQTNYFVVRLFVLEKVKQKVGLQGLPTVFRVDLSSFEYIPLTLPKRFPRDEIFVRIRESGEQCQRFNESLKNIHKAIASCLRERLDISDFCHEETEEDFRLEPIREKQELDRNREESRKDWERKRREADLERLRNIYIELKRDCEGIRLAFEMLGMGYEELIKWLTAKYGPVSGNYFTNEECRTKNAHISRGKEGLFVHHNREDMVPMLSSPIMAKGNPFEYQKSENLVYCNILEHLVLHVLLLPSLLRGNLTVKMAIDQGPRLIYEQINDCYFGMEPANDFRKAVQESLRGKFDAYIAVLTYLLQCVEKETGTVHPELIDQFSCGFDGKKVDAVSNALMENYRTLKGTGRPSETGE